MLYELNQEVTLAVRGKKGTVIGRAEYSFSDPSYLVRYKCADGRAVESWWPESALS